MKSKKPRPNNLTLTPRPTWPRQPCRQLRKQ